MLPETKQIINLLLLQYNEISYGLINVNNHFEKLNTFTQFECCAQHNLLYLPTSYDFLKNHLIMLPKLIANPIT